MMPRVGADGSLYSAAEAQAPVSARDGLGKDLMTWLAKRDRLIWEPAPAGLAEQEVVLTFNKPAGAQQAKLIASATETLFAGEAAGHMLGLLGPQLPSMV